MVQPPVASTVTRLSETDGSTVATIRGVARGPAAVAVAGDSVWVGGTLSGTLARIDPATNRVSGSVAVGGVPSALALDTNGDLWVAVHAA